MVLLPRWMHVGRHRCCCCCTIVKQRLCNTCLVFRPDWVPGRPAWVGDQIKEAGIAAHFASGQALTAIRPSSVRPKVLAMILYRLRFDAGSRQLLFKGRRKLHLVYSDFWILRNQTHLWHVMHYYSMKRSRCEIKAMRDCGERIWQLFVIYGHNDQKLGKPKFL